jgi:hypothetical protein
VNGFEGALSRCGVALALAVAAVGARAAEAWTASMMPEASASFFAAGAAKIERVTGRTQAFSCRKETRC